jgi:hypothetical protein
LNLFDTAIKAAGVLPVVLVVAVVIGREKCDGLKVVSAPKSLRGLGTRLTVAQIGNQPWESREDGSSLRWVKNCSDLQLIHHSTTHYPYYGCPVQRLVESMAIDTWE